MAVPAKRSRLFAEGLNIPIGVLPLPSSRAALVYSIPEILRLSDEDGDGRADRREPLYRKFGSNDTHGMTNNFTWGLDGWVYACHGFANTSEVRGGDGQKITLRWGSTYRMRADGSHVDVFTRGLVNPFGLTFDPRGDLYTCDSETQPIHLLLREAFYPTILTANENDGLGHAPPATTDDHYSSGIAGIACYAARSFPEPLPRRIVCWQSRDQSRPLATRPNGAARPRYAIPRTFSKVKTPGSGLWI